MARNPFAFNNPNAAEDIEESPEPAAPQSAPISDGGVDIDVQGDNDDIAAPAFDPETGTMTINLPDSSVVIDLNPRRMMQDEESDFDSNLAEELDEGVLNKIAEDLIEGIESDIQSRADWLEIRKKGIDLLGFKVENNGTRASPDATGAMEGLSTVRHPLLQEAVLRFQANAYAELCPAAGPCKVVNYGDENTNEDSLAEALEKDMNYYLTTTASEYFEDTNYMLFDVGFGGLGIKKVYNCPLRQRPVSERVDASNFIVSNAASDLKNAGRVTHEIMMRRTVMKRMQLLGVYRDITLTDPNPPELNVMQRKINQVQGLQPDNDRPEDQDYTIYECYCELDIPGFEHEDDGEPTGLPLPYKVTIDKDSHKILEIRRNWDEDDDEDYEANIPFVIFRYVNAMGFYGVGLLHILGNTTAAVTMAWRMMLDAYMYANFPGFLYLQGANRQTTNEFRIPPGGGAPVRSDAQDIRAAVMPLPYKSPDAAMNGFIDGIAATGQRVGGTADQPVGEGKQDAPVGTTLALIDQATKIESSVHKGLHASQDKEFRLLKELFRADPESLWRTNKRCALQRNVQKTLIALEDCDIVPRADPNVPSHMHRMAKIAAVKQLQMFSPQLYDPEKVDAWALPQIGIEDPEALFAPPPDPNAQPPIDPIKMQQLQNDRQKTAIQAQKLVADSANNAADRKSKENIAVLNLARELAVHPTSQGVVQGTLGGSSAPMAPDAASGMADGGIVHNVMIGDGSHGGVHNGSSLGVGPYSTAHMAGGGTVQIPQDETQQKLAYIAQILAAQRQPKFNPHLNGYDVGVI